MAGAEAVGDIFSRLQGFYQWAMLKKTAENLGFLDSFRTDTLDYLLNLSVNIPLDKAVEDGARVNSTYFH